MGVSGDHGGSGQTWSQVVGVGGVGLHLPGLCPVC